MYTRTYAIGAALLYTTMFTLYMIPLNVSYMLPPVYQSPCNEHQIHIIFTSWGKISAEPRSLLSGAKSTMNNDISLQPPGLFVDALFRFY